LPGLPILLNLRALPGLDNLKTLVVFVFKACSTHDGSFAADVCVRNYLFACFLFYAFHDSDRLCLFVICGHDDHVANVRLQFFIRQSVGRYVVHVENWDQAAFLGLLRLQSYLGSLCLEVFFLFCFFYV
jgi:hypothetical protein